MSEEARAMAELAGEAAWAKAREILAKQLPHAEPVLRLLDAAKSAVVAAAVDTVRVTAPGVEVRDYRTP